MMGTLGNNERLEAALDLLRFKGRKAVTEERDSLTIEEINEVLIVAGVKVVMPEKEVEVIV